MKKLIVVIGLPGSGKSHYLRNLRDDGTVGWICEDFHVDAYRNSPCVVDSRHLEPLVEALNKEVACAVADIAFCDPIRRDEFEDEIRLRVPDVQIEFQCFEDNKKLCAENAERRARKILATELDFIKKQRYEFPPGAKIRPVYKEGA